MKDLFVPYEIAVQLKEIGFNEPCLVIHSFVDGELNFMYVNTFHSNDDVNELSAAAPTFSQAFEFFREKYNLLGCTQYFTGGYYCYTINDMKDTKESNRLFAEFSSYEGAELACLDRLIQIVKNK